jgi:hypothetical protein
MNRVILTVSVERVEEQAKLPREHERMQRARIGVGKGCGDGSLIAFACGSDNVAICFNSCSIEDTASPGSQVINPSLMRLS